MKLLPCIKKEEEEEEEAIRNFEFLIYIQFKGMVD